MPVDPIANAVETFSAPIEGLIVALGKGIAEAQTEMDRNSINTQVAIDADPVLSALGLQAPWYHFQRTDVELKLAITVIEDRSATTASRLAVPAISADLPVARRVIAQPVSAAYQNHFNYNAQASSTITLSIVPVPPPVSADQASSPPRLTSDEVQQTAVNSPAAFATTTVQGKKVPVTNKRFDVNFNAAARLWYVLQYDPSDPATKAVVVTVDDVTGLARVIT